jgi:hypothetical protein
LKIADVNPKMSVCDKIKGTRIGLQCCKSELANCVSADTLGLSERVFGFLKVCENSGNVIYYTFMIIKLVVFCGLRSESSSSVETLQIILFSHITLIKELCQ